MRLKHFAEVFLVGYLGTPRVVEKGSARFVFCGLSTSIREKLDDAAYQALTPINRLLMEYTGYMKNRIITRVETWHNLVGRSKKASDSIELFRTKPRNVIVRGKLTRHSFKKAGKTRTGCEVQVYDPILPSAGRSWTSLLDIQGRLVADPTFEFISYTDDVKDATAETILKLLVERSYRSKTSKSGWETDKQYFEVTCIGEQWADIVRDLKTGQTVRVLTTLGYDTDEKTLVETPLLGALHLIDQQELYAIEKGQPLPNEWDRFINPR